MKLKTARVREFKSIWDSNPFEIDRMVCLVGKNEAGKTALLQALYRLNPIVPGEATFDVTDDYPRSEVEDYMQAVETEQRSHATVVEATFELEELELRAIADEYGEGILTKTEFTLSKAYEASKRSLSLPVNENAILKNLISHFEFSGAVAEEIARLDSLEDASERLAERAQLQQKQVTQAEAEAAKLEDDGEKATALEKAKSLAEPEQAKALRARLTALLGHGDLAVHIWETHLKPHLPKFLYFDDYYRLRGHDNIEELKKRKEANKLEKSDHPLLGLIELARIDLDKLLAAQRTQELKNKLQGASNHLSGQILKYWSQNKHLRMNFDVRPALPGDPERMREGHNIWGEVFDAKHLVSTGLGTRSAGFVWFFSFLAWYSAVKKKNEPLVLLLDEPGLSLHGKAQEDLLRYFEAEIVTNPKHQLVYTTHSPFMVDPRHFERVRIVQDKGIDSNEALPREEDGTKVFTDVLEAGADTLFPLQGALGYEIYQSLFIGPNSVVVEGASDLLYIQAVSAALQARDRVGLDSRWTITPVGGADKVPTFVALIAAQKHLNVATLIDFQKSDQQMVENLYKKKLLDKSHVLTFADFTGQKEADIEDMFDEAFYLDLVNAEFSSVLSAKIKAKDLTSKAPRILVRLEEHLSKNPLASGAKFNHYRPARLLTEKSLKIPEKALDRFEAAFKALNALLA